MPRSVGNLSALDKAASEIHSLIADATYPLEDSLRLFIKIETVSTDSGQTAFEVSGGILEGRERKVSYAWRRRGRKPSTLLRALVKQYPAASCPPQHFAVACRSSLLNPATAHELLLKALAEAGPQPTPASSTPARSSNVVSASPNAPVSWASALREGPEGLTRWNRLKSAERSTVDLSGADLSGLDLGGLKLRGVTAKRASFVGSRLVRAELVDGTFDWADFSSANLEAARLKGVRAPEARFQGARLAGGVLRGGLYFGASFSQADLTGADLKDANLINADLTGAHLDGAALEGASFDQRTRWPDGFVIPAEVIFAGRGTDPRLIGKGKNAVARDVSGLVARLQSLIDPKRMKRTLDMLKKGRNQLFAEVEPTFVRGIVRSQSEEELVYACVLKDDGTYACCTPDVNPCLGIRGEPCKHLLVLIIGLSRAGELDASQVDPWIVAASKKNRRHESTRDHLLETLLRYKSMKAGQFDWRPTETIPEDFYAI